MKNALKFLSIVMLSLSMNSFAQEAPAKMKKTKHVCTAECKTGKHAYKHGEKGHICTDECKMEPKAKIKHGEKGHVCDASCHSM